MSTRTIDEPRRRITDTERCPPPRAESDTIPAPQAEIDADITYRLERDAYRTRPPVDVGSIKEGW